MKSAHGAMPTKPFSKGIKQTRRPSNNWAQTTTTSQWSPLETAKTSVDVKRANWPGLLWVQAGVYDPRPRLIQKPKFSNVARVV